MKHQESAPGRWTTLTRNNLSACQGGEHYVYVDDQPTGSLELDWRNTLGAKCYSFSPPDRGFSVTSGLSSLLANASLAAWQAYSGEDIVLGPCP